MPAPSVQFHTQSAPTTPFPGVVRRILAHSPTLMLTEHRFEAGTDLPRHAHPEEQSVYIVRGRLRLLVAGQPPVELGEGDSLIIPGDVPHSAFAVEETVALDGFAPARRDYLPTV